MKILHTSDLHIGHTFFTIERLDEHKRLFEWLKKTIELENIDVLIVSGDIFDTYYPSAAALKLYYDFLHSIKNLVKKVVITGGNHDSPKTLMAPGSILKELDIEVVSGADGDCVRVVEFEDFRIVAVSYLREGILARWGDDYVAAIKEIYSRHLGDKPSMAMAHFTVYGSRCGESEREIYVGSVEGVPSHVFDGYGYVALGHIHRPQEVAEGIVYSGSPLQMGFDEDYGKKAVIIESGDFSYRFIDIPKFRDFIRIKGSYEEVSKRIGELRPKSFVEIELNEFVDSTALDRLRRDDLHIVKTVLPFTQISCEGIEVDRVTPVALVKEIFKDDDDLEELVRVVKRLGAEDED